jgi:hypothetical protein
VSCLSVCSHDDRNVIESTHTMRCRDKRSRGRQLKFVDIKCITKEVLRLYNLSHGDLAVEFFSGGHFENDVCIRQFRCHHTVVNKGWPIVSLTYK